VVGKLLNVGEFLIMLAMS